MINKFWEDFETGNIYIRDNWQLELKEEFVPENQLEETFFTQEFYIYIPNSLQINDHTYSKTNFYEDQTTLIRYKTPHFTFEELNDPLNTDSPLAHLELIEKKLEPNGPALVRELKLFANIFRSTLRDQVHFTIEKLDQAKDYDDKLENIKIKIYNLLLEIKQTRALYDKRVDGLEKRWHDVEHRELFGYVNDFLSISINYSLSILLENIRSAHQSIFQDVDELICAILKEEKSYRENRVLEPVYLDKDSLFNESVLYQSSLLNKFFVDVLFLNISRAAIDQKYGPLIGSVAAAIAMLFYVLLFIWQGSYFVINSQPFILFSVILYVLKDRLKDEIKTLSYKHASKWFSDFTTEIVEPSGKYPVGELRESFCFINEDSVPEEISRARQREFHIYLETIKRPERVIYYKQSMRIFPHTEQRAHARLNALRVIFRYDIRRFLTKASDPYEQHASLDPQTNELTHNLLPKVYHVNIILKNSEVQSGVKKTTIKKFRIIVDKAGIKRIENVSHST